jgi:hypothetical protein
MRKLALALAAAAAIGIAAPTFAIDAAQAAGTKMAQANVDVKVKARRGDDKIVVRHDRGWSHARHYGERRHVTIVKTSPHHRVVVKKKIEG